MRILLNLLPEEKRSLLVRKFRFRFLLWQTALVLFLVLFYVIVLGGVYSILNYQTRVNQDALMTFDQFNDEAKKLVSYQEVFKRVNAETESVNRYQQLHLHWSILPDLLQSLTPPGVVVIELLTQDYTVSLVGQSGTREEFLQFEDALKNAECVSDVRVPISNLFAQREVDFQVEFKLKRECLIKP